MSRSTGRPPDHAPAAQPVARRPAGFGNRRQARLLALLHALTDAERRSVRVADIDPARRTLVV